MKAFDERALNDSETEELVKLFDRHDFERQDSCRFWVLFVSRSPSTSVDFEDPVVSDTFRDAHQATGNKFLRYSFHFIIGAVSSTQNVAILTQGAKLQV